LQVLLPSIDRDDHLVEATARGIAGGVHVPHLERGVVEWHVLGDGLLGDGLGPLHGRALGRCFRGPGVRGFSRVRGRVGSGRLGSRRLAERGRREQPQAYAAQTGYEAPHGSPCSRDARCSLVHNACSHLGVLPRLVVCVALASGRTGFCEGSRPDALRDAIAIRAWRGGQLATE
jgi:hypothetical protein